MSAIIPAMLRRLVLLLTVSSVLLADPLEDAARTLAAKVTPYLAPNETARLTSRNISALPVHETGLLRHAFENALPKRSRSKTVVDVALTISENTAGYLLVAQIHKGELESVEMVSVRWEPQRPLSALRLITRHLLWEQDDVMLDLAQVGGRMLVLEPEALVLFEQQNNAWLPGARIPMDAPKVRDPRGRLEVTGNDISVFLPGATCRGQWEPPSLHCDRSTSEFTLDGNKAHFLPRTNQLAGVSSSPADKVAICAKQQLVSGTGAWNAPDSVIVSDGTNPLSEPVEFPGPVTALWPTAEGALAIVHNFNTNQYAAYLLAVDCHQ